MPNELARASSLKALLIVAVLGVGALSLLGAASTAAGRPLAPNSFQWYAATGPTTVDVPAFSGTPGVPSQWTVAQSAAVLLTNDAPGSWGFAFGTSTNVGSCTFSTCGGGYGGPETVAAFPSLLSDLSNNAVSCFNPFSPTPFDTPYAIANSTLYLPVGATIHIDSLSDDGLAIYSSPYGSTSWTSVLGDGWVSGYTPASMTLSAGYYTIAVAWYNSCGQGEAAVQFSGLPTGAYFTTAAPPSPPPFSPPAPTLNACEVQGLKACYTSFLVFSTGQADATVTLATTTDGPALASGTNGSPVAGGISALPVNLTLFGCLTGETGQFVVVSGVGYTYTVKYADGTSVTGIVAAVAPWTIQVVRVS